MKRFIALFLLLITILALLSSCGDSKTIDGVWYDTYGVFSIEKMDPDIHYEPILRNFIPGIILIETILVPIYIIGWDMWEPIGPRQVKVVPKAKEPEPEIEIKKIKKAPEIKEISKPAADPENEPLNFGFKNTRD